MGFSHPHRSAGRRGFSGSVQHTFSHSEFASQCSRRRRIGLMQEVRAPRSRGLHFVLQMYKRLCRRCGDIDRPFTDFDERVPEALFSPLQLKEIVAVLERVRVSAIAQ